MPNLGSFFKSEISRIARREIRQDVQALRKAGAGYRREIAQLKRRIANLEAATGRLTKASSGSLQPGIPATAAAGTPTRFVAKGLRSLRQRLGLSAADFARLLGVSMQSVYNWEQKKSVPRRSQVDAIVALRGVGKKDVQARLSQTRSSRNPGSTRRAPTPRSRRK